MRVPLTTRDFLDRAELVYGDRVGIVDEPAQPAPSLGEVTYREVARRARAMQAPLDGLGIGEGDRVAVVSHNAGRLVEMLLGVPSSGRVLVPVNFRLSQEEVAYIVGHSGARVLMVDPELEASLKGIEAEHRFTLGEEYEQLLDYDTEPRPWAEPDEDATATINYTSGTTARPKGVQMSHRNEWVNAVTFGMHMQVSDRDVYLHTLPLFHCNGWGMAYTTAGLGARQVLIRKVDGAEILRRVEQHGVTLMSGAPAVWNSVLDAAADWDGEIPGRDRVRIVVAGAPPPSRPTPGSRRNWDGSSTRSTASPRPRPSSPSTVRARSTTTWIPRTGPSGCPAPGRRPWAPGCGPVTRGRCWCRATPS